MNLADNLKKIRKDNNLSQEDLAEKLGVSRQSVSKWESGLAYPEMDKVLQICKMFDVKLDDLLNNDINKLEKENKSKINISKYVDDFLGFFRKTIDMFTNMKVRDIIKCAIEQIIIIFILTIILKIFGGVLNDILRNILFFLNDKTYDIIYNIFSSLYFVISAIIIVIIVVHIFKTRYLDYYKEEEKIESKKDDSKEEIKEEKKEEKIIIRDPEHSGDKFVSALFKVLLIVLKIFLLSFVGFLCFTFVGFVICFVLSFMFIKTGTFFVGIILSILACLLVVFIFLNLLYHFYINTKPKFTLLGLAFLLALISFGIGCGLLVYNIPKFDLIDTNDKKYYTTEKKTYDMTDDMMMSGYGYILDYKEADSNDVVIECRHPKLYGVSIEKNDNYIYIKRKVNNEMDIVRQVIYDINKKTIVNYDNVKVTVYTSKENIEKLKENKEKERLKSYEKNNHDLEQRLEQKEEKINELESRIEKLES